MIKWIKKTWDNFCWHKWLIIYYSPSGLFVEIECAKCGIRDHRGF